MFVFAYGVGAYVMFVLTFCYAVGFTENWLVAFTIDGTHAGHAGGWILNLVLMGLFAGVHSGMSHPDFQRLWRAFVPPVLARSTHVLASCLFLMLLFLRWTPMPFVLWDLGLNPLSFAVEMISYGGWMLALAATLQIDHLELFGLKQVLCHVRGEPVPAPEFQVPSFYRWVRHPIYLGLLIAVWSAPRMTLGHLLFAALVTLYLRSFARQEERTLAQVHPEYRTYQARVPMFNPFHPPVVVRRKGPARRAG